MGLFSKSSDKDKAEASGALDPEDKPLPDLAKRPGTSSTELGLRANRQKASSAFERAQRAEQAYRAKRRAEHAKKDMQTAKEHYSTAWTSFKAATLYTWHVAKAGPAVFKEGARVKRDAQKQAAEVKRRAQVEAKKKKLEEEIKKAEEAAAAAASADEPPAESAA